MLIEIGHFAMILALLLSAAQAFFGLAGAALKRERWLAVVPSAVAGQFLFLALGTATLVHAFVVNDFSVKYVAEHSNSALPLFYRISALWGAHEGSLLLWICVLGLWTVAVALRSDHLPRAYAARVLGVLGVVSFGFLLFLLSTSSPFERLFPAAVDGNDLNPLLQDFAMAIHPPILYTGYVGMSVSFAFAIAALIEGRIDAAWARWVRPWTLVAWIFLTLGIAMGSYWAYYELGWGGWWFWDPVENACFMPWLVGTALIHSLAVTEKRGAFRSWTVLLAILAFSLSLLGTFLVRSGVLTSVHAFATDPARGVFILVLLVVVIGGSLLLYVWRAPRIGLGGGFEPVSRESMLLANNVMFAAAAGSVLLGTLYPLALDASGLGKISVGPPYFETVFVPLMAPALFLMGIGPLARWKKASLPDIAARLRWALAASLVAALAIPLAMGRWSALVAFGILLAAWVAASGVVQLYEKIGNAANGASAWARLRNTPRATYGMLLAHFGVAVFVTGVTLVKGYDSEKDVRMEPGDTAELGGYTFRLDGVRDVQGPNYVAARAQIQVSREGRAVTTLYPEKRIYTVQNMPMTEAAIDPGFTRDLYVSLGDSVSATAWIVRVQHKPFIDWIWGGCLLMALGGALAASDRRYRLAAKRQEPYAAAQAAR